MDSGIRTRDLPVPVWLGYDHRGFQFIEVEVVVKGSDSDFMRQ